MVVVWIRVVVVEGNLGYILKVELVRFVIELDVKSEGKGFK